MSGPAVAQERQFLREIRGRERGNWGFIPGCCCFRSTAREISGKDQPKGCTGCKSRKIPWRGSWERPGRGDGAGIVVSPGFYSGIALRGDRSCGFAPHRLGKCHEGLFGCVWAPALTVLGAGSNKPTRDTELAASCAQNPAPEATLMQPLGCADQMCSNSELYSRETAKKSIRGALLMRVSFWKWRN